MHLYHPCTLFIDLTSKNKIPGQNLIFTYIQIFAHFHQLYIEKQIPHLNFGLGHIVLYHVLIGLYSTGLPTSCPKSSTDIPCLGLPIENPDYSFPIMGLTHQLTAHLTSLTLGLHISDAMKTLPEHCPQMYTTNHGNTVELPSHFTKIINSHHQN